MKNDQNCFVWHRNCAHIRACRHNCVSILQAVCQFYKIIQPLRSELGFGLGFTPVSWFSFFHIFPRMLWVILSVPATACTDLKSKNYLLCVKWYITICWLTHLSRNESDWYTIQKARSIISLHYNLASTCLIIPRALYRVVQNKVEHFIFILYIMYITHMGKSNAAYHQYLHS